MGCCWIAVLSLCFNEDQAVHRQLVLKCKAFQQQLHEGQIGRKRDTIDG